MVFRFAGAAGSGAGARITESRNRSTEYVTI
jgi:hypothetical protein